MAKTLSRTLFGRKFTLGEWILTVVSLTAGTLSIVQTVFVSSSLSVGIEDNVTKTSGGWWIAFLGLLIFILFFVFARGKKR